MLGSNQVPCEQYWACSENVVGIEMEGGILGWTEALLQNSFEVSRLSSFGCAKPSFEDASRLGPNLDALPASIVWRLEPLAQHRRVLRGQKTGFVMVRNAYEPKVMSKTPV